MTNRTSKTAKPNERTPNERPPERTRQKSRANTSPLVGSGPAGQDPSEKNVERPSVLAAKLIEFMRTMRRANLSMDKIANVLKVSKSTVHAHVSDIIPDTTVDPDLDPEPSSPSTPVTFQAPTVVPVPTPMVSDGNGQEHPTEARMPRLSSEVAARRPVIVDDDNGSDLGSHSLDSQIEVRGPYGLSRYDSAGSVQPAFSNQAWETIRLMIHGSAMRDGFSDPLEYFNQVILVDLRTADLVRTLIPHHDVESLRRNLNTIVRKAVAYDKARQDAGLDEMQDQATNKTSDSELEGPSK